MHQTIHQLGKLACRAAALGVAGLLTIAEVAAASECGVEQEWSNKRIVTVGSATPWPDPGAREIPGKFPCLAKGTCSLDDVLQDGRVCALLVVKHGKLVYEYYDKSNEFCADRDKQGNRLPSTLPNNGHKPYGIASITKSITSTLFGLVKSDPVRYRSIGLDDPVSNYATLPSGSHISTVTLRQALLMRTAIDYDEDHNCLRDWTVKNRANSISFTEAVGRYKNRNHRQEPGKSFYYAGIDTTLIGLTVESVLAKTGGSGPRHLDEALSEWIWRTQGMEANGRWKADRFDMPIPYCCFEITARDLAHFGQYILKNAQATYPTPETPLANWVRWATAYDDSLRVGSCRILGERVRYGYGYQWWTFPGKGGFTGWGIHGQFVHVFPEQDVVVAQLSEWKTPHDTPRTCDSFSIHQFLADAVWQ